MSITTCHDYGEHHDIRPRAELIDADPIRRDLQDVLALLQAPAPDAGPQVEPAP